MIEFSLEDDKGNIFSLNGVSVTNTIGKNSLGFQNESFNIDTNIIEKSSLPGSIRTNDPRIESRVLEFVLNVSDPDYTAYQSFISGLLYNLNKVAYLRDETGSRRIEVTLNNFNISYDGGVGSQWLSSNVSFSLTCLKPYWEDINFTETNYTVSASVTNEFTFTNNGYLEVQPVIEFVVAAPCSFFEIILVAENDSIRIEDPIFGTPGNGVITIDNEQGFVEIDNLDRTVYVIGGLGFISLPVGISDIQIISSVAATAKFYHRNRYYV